MKKYLTTAVISLYAGTVLGLSAKQAALRAHALETLKTATPDEPAAEGKPAKAGSPGVYRALATVQFKAGETIGLEAAPPKHLADELIDEKEAAQRAKAEKTEKAQKPGKAVPHTPPAEAASAPPTGSPAGGSADTAGAAK